MSTDIDIRLGCLWKAPRNTSVDQLNARILELREETSVHRTPTDGYYKLLLELSDALGDRYELDYETGDLNERLVILRRLVALPRADLPTQSDVTLPSDPLATDQTRQAHNGAYYFSRPLIEAYLAPPTASLWQHATISAQQLQHLDMWANAMLAICDILVILRRTQDIAPVATEIIDIARTTLYLLPEGHRLEPHALIALGVGYFARASETGAKVDQEEGSVCLAQSVATCQSNGHVCARCLLHLAKAFTLRWFSSRDHSLLIRAIDILQQALLVTPCTNDRMRAHIQLEITLCSWNLSDMRGDWTQHKQYLEDLIGIHAQLTTHSNDDLPGKILTYCGIISFSMFPTQNSAQHLHEALKFLQNALSLHPSHHPSRRYILAKISIVFQRMYDHSGSVQYVWDAVNTSRKATEISTSTLRGGLEPLRAHAMSVSLLFSITGDSAYLEEAIASQRAALDRSSIGLAHISQDAVRNGLGTNLLCLYEISGDLRHLDEAINIMRSVMDGKQPGHPRANIAVLNLGIALCRRFEDLGDASALDEAIVNCNCWLAFQELDSFTRYRVLYGRAKALSLQYKLTVLPAEGALQYLDTLRTDFQHVLTLMGPNSDHHHDILLEMGKIYLACLEVRFTHTNYELAFKLYYELLHALPVGHPRRTLALLGLSMLNVMSGTSKHAVSGIEYLQTALLDFHCPPQTRLSHALDILEKVESMAMHSKSSNDRYLVLKAYKHALDLLPHVAYVGLDAQTKLRMLSKAKGLASAASVQAIRADKLEDAVVSLEQGRAVFWMQYFRLREPLHDASDNMHQDLKSVANTIRAGMLQAEAMATHNSDDGRVKLGQHSMKLARLSERFEQLVSQARQHPRDGQFLKTPPMDALVTAGNGSDIVILLSGASGCFAILIEASPGARNAMTSHRLAIETSDISKAMSDMRQSARLCRAGLARNQRALKVRANKGLSVSNPLLCLWNAAMKHIISAFKFQKSQGKQRRRLFVCATGAFANTPLHSAGDERDACSDYCVVSYIPSLTALINARRQRPRISKESVRVLLAGVSRPYRGALLHCVEDEIQAVLRILPNNSCHILSTAKNTPPDMHATAEALHRYLPNANIAHFACHGEQDRTDPLESGFLMADSKFTVAHLMEMDLKPAFLAILSACETAKGDANQPDQVIHLAAALLFAGFPSVVATMWSMNDADGPLIAETIYRALLESDGDYLDPEVVPYALDAAVANLRQRGCHLSRWAPYVHIGA